jgi:RNA polymerase sigma factor (TIGR02999 family)
VRSGEVTRLLREARSGEREAMDRLVPLVYEELRAVARRQMRRERPDHTLHPTALVHEAWVKLAVGPVEAADRAHFLAIAGRAMRQVLIDHARTHNAVKRGRGWERLTLMDGDRPVELNTDELLALDIALESLEPRQRQVVEYKFFAGMEEQDIALVLGVTDRTVRRDWVKARAWLYRALYERGGDSSREEEPAT